MGLELILMKKTIYRDFNHWWQEGNHGWTSASIDFAREIWDDLEPTILASRDEYKDVMVETLKTEMGWRIEMLSIALEYIEKYKQEDAPKFFKFYLDYKRKEK